MSMDLEFPKNLPKIRLPLQVRSPPKPSLSDNIIPSSDHDSDLDRRSCRTPTSAEHKIPKILSCPGAPKKPKRPPVPCKRKLTMELKFFEIVNQEEVDNFFRSAYDLESSSTAPPKRNCCRPSA
ncbi:cyclin-dependent protein kinase inhibitor SMR1-like [Cucumis melo var. makuwa]|uniref:Cyclin-dependent protein kinase inhibitor SMR1-like n=2 Tax=Cucumis melo TaxID=3656 RepID=A0A1S3C3L4_CUCME|nr:cyclin-dependent protein kinase inhibitor SMR1-like [Cucumis melo]KAA0057132.1 cyclin-dependent protein kinase inhibitor SMR1-like [Cucumis melo var. makuwa]TYJ97113.1 cyclin-dependent protein kinase inhibitor SMR1-like [Cucumis melo var. makuwa]